MKIATRKVSPEGNPSRGDPLPQNSGQKRSDEPGPGVQKVHELRQLPVPQSIINELPCSRWWFEVAFALLESGLPTLKAELENAARRDHVSFAKAFVAFYKLREQFNAIFSKEDETIGSFHQLWKRTVEDMTKTIEGAGVTNVPLAEGIRVSSISKTRASILPDQRDKAWAWLRQNGYGDLVTTTVNSSSLSSLAGDLEEKNLALPREYFKSYYQPVIQVTKIRGKGAVNGDT